LMNSSSSKSFGVYFVVSSSNILLPREQLTCGRLSAVVRHMSRTTNFRNPGVYLWVRDFNLICLFRPHLLYFLDYRSADLPYPKSRKKFVSNLQFRSGGAPIVGA
jgi:hypothetical protein